MKSLNLSPSSRPTNRQSAVSRNHHVMPTAMSVSTTTTANNNGQTISSSTTTSSSSSSSSSSSPRNTTTTTMTISSTNQNNNNQPVLLSPRRSATPPPPKPANMTGGGNVVPPKPVTVGPRAGKTEVAKSLSNLQSAGFSSVTSLPTIAVPPTSQSQQPPTSSVTNNNNNNNTTKPGTPTPGKAGSKLNVNFLPPLPTTIKLTPSVGVVLGKPQQQHQSSHRKEIEIIKAMNAATAAGTATLSSTATNKQVDANLEKGKAGGAAAAGGTTSPSFDDRHIKSNVEFVKR